MTIAEFQQVIIASIPIALAIIGATEAIKKLLPTVVAGTVTIAVAVILGLLAGISGIAGLNWFVGILIGLAAAGGVTLVGKVGSSNNS